MQHFFEKSQNPKQSSKQIEITNLQIIHQNSQNSWIDIKYGKAQKENQTNFQKSKLINNSSLFFNFVSFGENSKNFGISIVRKNFQFLAASLVIFSLISSNLFGANAVFAQDTSILKTKYEQRKSEIDKKQGEISKNLNEVTGKYQSSNNQEKNLKDEIAKQKGEIEKVENQITESKVVINQIDEQIKKNELQITEIKKQVGIIVVEIQKQERISPMQTVLTSNSLEEAMGKMYNLSSLQTQAKSTM